MTEVATSAMTQAEAICDRLVVELESQELDGLDLLNVEVALVFLTQDLTRVLRHRAVEEGATVTVELAGCHLDTAHESLRWIRQHRHTATPAAVLTKLDQVCESTAEADRLLQ